MEEIIYTPETLMKNEYPKIKKLGICSPNGETTPFMWNGKLMRLELVDPYKGTNSTVKRFAGIRDVESKKIVSTFAEDCYFHCGFKDGDTFYVTGVDMKRRDTIRLYQTKDLINWTSRDLLSNPGWVYFNSSIAKGPNGYVIVLESGPDAYPYLNNWQYPKKYVSNNGWTLFFATSPDLVNWTFMPFDESFSKEIPAGGPWLKYVDGWFYLGADCVLPRRIFSHYLYRTKDFKKWYVGYYNPVMMPSNEDKLVSPNMADISDEELLRIKSAFNVNNTDLDMCDYNGKTYINYLCGNQYGNYWMCEAIVDKPLNEFLNDFFE